MLLVDCDVVVRSENRLYALGLAELFQYGEDTVSDYVMIVQRVCLSQNHVGKVSTQRIAPQVSYKIGLFRVLGNVPPMIHHCSSKVPGVTMDGEPGLLGLFVFAVLNEVVATTESAEAFVKYSFLQFYSPAELCDETSIDAWSIVN